MLKVWKQRKVKYQRDNKKVSFKVYIILLVVFVLSGVFCCLFAEQSTSGELGKGSILLWNGLEAEFQRLDLDELLEKAKAENMEKKTSSELKVPEEEVKSTITTNTEISQQKDMNTGGKGIFLKKCGFSNPGNYDFGKYQTYADTLYRALLNCDRTPLRFSFDTHEEGVAFTQLFHTHVLPEEVCLYEVHYSGSEKNEEGVFVPVYQVIYFDEEYAPSGLELLDLEVLQTLSYDACVAAGLYDGMSEKEAVNMICHWIMNHMNYCLNDANAYEGFLTGSGQCHTYAKMLEAMCDTVGISCEYVTGTANESSHAWNRVFIGDTWFYVDVTWADSTGNTQYLLSDGLWSSHRCE